MNSLLFAAIGSLIVSQAPPTVDIPPPLSLPTTYVDATEHVGYGDEPEIYISLGPGFDNVGPIPSGRSRLTFRGYAESYDEHGDAAQIILHRFRHRGDDDYEFLDWTALPPPVNGEPVRVPINAEWVFDEIYPVVTIEFQGGYAESGMLLGGTAEYTIGVPEPAGMVLAAVGLLMFVERLRRRRFCGTRSRAPC